jgi:hypothetical protein
MLTQSSVLTSLNQLDLKNVMEHHYEKGIALEHIQITKHGHPRLLLSKAKRMNFKRQAKIMGGNIKLSFY